MAVATILMAAKDKNLWVSITRRASPYLLMISVRWSKESSPRCWVTVVGCVFVKITLSMFNLRGSKTVHIGFLLIRQEESVIHYIPSF